jgi:hypothetical protein
MVIRIQPDNHLLTTEPFKFVDMLRRLDIACVVVRSLEIEPVGPIEELGFKRLPSYAAAAAVVGDGSMETHPLRVCPIAGLLRVLVVDR